MGIFSAFGKESQTSSVAGDTTTNGTQQSEVSGLAANVNGGGALNVSVLDNGAIAEAFNFAGVLGEGSNALAEMVIEKAFETVDGNADAAFQTANDSTAAAMAAAMQAVQPEPIDLKMVGIVAAAGIAVIYLITHRG